ncbi:hypothetical protein [Vulcanisaeta souniana]|uniref:hypothetical protein n=1 Tax=Vulcanisaeta souniana TaxID=164452 RepID=UPI001FB2F713|nr:hypothetical protein [Vulcanisaeta souniana]
MRTSEDTYVEFSISWRLEPHMGGHFRPSSNFDVSSDTIVWVLKLAGFLINE